MNMLKKLSTESRMKLIAVGTFFLSFSFACGVSAIVLFFTLFIVEMPFISSLSKITVFFIVVLGTITAILLGVISFRTAFPHLKDILLRF
jgi:hypothetical protein